MGVVGCGLELDHRPGEDPVHANCPSPPCGTTRTRPAPGPPAPRGRVVRRRRPAGRGRPPARGLGSGGQRLYGRFKAGGTEALRSRGPSGPTPRLSDAQLATVEQALLEGATAHGFAGELWTLDRIAIVIERLTGVQHHPAHVWALLRHRLGWSVQRPKRRAVERDQAAIDRWV
jgi:transposase